MANYAIRIRRSYNELERFSEYLNKVSSKWVIYEHPEQGNVHIHGLLLGCTATTDTLKNQIKKALNVTTMDKTHWSFKTEYKDDGQLIKITEDNSGKFITYMSKGKYEPKGFKGYVIEYLQERVSAWVTPTNGLKGLAPKTKVTYTTIQETPAQKKKRKIDLLAEMELIVDKEILELRKDDLQFEPTPRKKFKIFYNAFVKVMNDNHEFVTKYKFEEYYTTFLCRENGEAMENIANEVFRKLFSNGIV